MMRQPLLSYQGMFHFISKLSKGRKNVLHLLNMKVHRDIREIYPITWSRPLMLLCREMNNNVAKTFDMLEGTGPTRLRKPSSSVFSVPLAMQMPNINLLCLAIGGHHSLVLIAKREVLNSNDFSGGVERIHHSTASAADCRFISSVYAWGWNDRGQLGNADLTLLKGNDVRSRNKVYVPKNPLKFLEEEWEKKTNPETGRRYYELVKEINHSEKIEWVGAGDDHCLALTSGGIVFTWGDNKIGQCGQGHRLVQIPTPKVIASLVEANISITCASVGARHSAVVTSSGKVLIWGANLYVGLETFPEHSHTYSPQVVPGLENSRAIQVCCGCGFNVVRPMSVGGIYIWGRNDRGQLGTGQDEKTGRAAVTFVPIGMEIRNTVVHRIAVGADFVVACVLPGHNRLFAWGRLKVFESKEESVPEKQTGGAGLNPFMKYGGLKKRDTPKESSSTKKTESSISVGKAVREPTLIQHSLWNKLNITDIACGNDEVMVLTEEGTVYGFNFLEVRWIKKSEPEEKSDVSSITSARMSFPSFAFAAKAQQPEPKPKIAIEQVETLKGIYTFQPALFNFRHLMPTNMRVESLGSSFNSSSLSLFWAIQKRADGTRISKEVTPTELFTVTGDTLQIPQRVQKAHEAKRAKELALTILTSSLPIPDPKDYYSSGKRLGGVESQADPRLMDRMRSAFSANVQKKSRVEPITFHQT